MFIPVGIRFRQLTWPTGTIALIACNVLMYVAQQFLADSFLMHLMLVPDTVDPIAWITSMFMHADVMHLLGNMVFLWTFGTYLELRLGWQRLLVLYLLSGLAAGLTFLCMNWGDSVPMLGASGAIAGLMGLCVAAAPLGKLSILPLHPAFLAIAALKTRRLTIAVPLVFWVGLWVYSQVMYAWLGVPGVAFSAHFGGIGAGLLIGLAMRATVVPDYELEGPATEEEVRAEKRERFINTVAAAWAGRAGERKPVVDYLSTRPPNFHDKRPAEGPPITYRDMMPDDPLDD
ncbi:MAG: rhomboid family intramembrane serine protease [Planctomycetes bacterium]|nr:rhomboid family intramembrane serine protease [Planctomycetota bacterium]